MHYLTVVVLLFEASTPFLKVRELLIAADATGGRLFAVTNAAFALLFFAARIVLGNIEAVRFYVSVEGLIASGKAHSVILVRFYEVCSFALLVLNLVWFAKIAGNALAVARKTKAP